MDVLADVLQTLRLSAHTYFCSEFAAPWGMAIDHGATGVFHAVIEGESWLTLAGDDAPLHLVAGDVVAFPTGGSHQIGDRDGRRRLPGVDVVTQVQAGANPFAEGEFSVTLLCGSFTYDTAIDHPFLKELPCFIHIRGDEHQEKWLHPFIEALAGESRRPRPGSQVLIDRLTEILFIQLMRCHMQQARGNVRYLAALMDPQMGVALSHIHGDDKARWTVERLADAVAMSRTTFTDKFTRAVGISPKSYMINWRMQKARDRLRAGREPMTTIAEAAGYASEAAFSRAYKQFFGVTPGASRLVR